MASKLLEAPRSVTDTDREIGERVRARREEIGARQRQVAAMVGISHQQYQKYEAGETRVSAAMLIRVAEALDIDVMALLPGSVAKRAKREKPKADPQASLLLNAFQRIGSARERKLVVDLALRLSEFTPTPPKRKARP